MIPEPIQIALVTALLSAATTYLALVTKVRRDLEAQYDKDLRDRRLAVYPALWGLSEPLARYSPAGPLSVEGARALSEKMRQWYFRDGLVMSLAARQAYFDLQSRLVDAAAAAEPPDSNAFKGLQKASSIMHAALCGDVGSRRPPMIGAPSQGRWRKMLGHSTE